jgi:hypothetical protein
MRSRPKSLGYTVTFSKLPPFGTNERNTAKKVTRANVLPLAIHDGETFRRINRRYILVGFTDEHRRKNAFIFILFRVFVF